MFDETRYIRAVSALQPTTPISLPKPRHRHRTTMLAAACIALLVTLTVAASAAKTTVYGWGKNAALRGNGVILRSSETRAEPLSVENGKIIFLVNGENLDLSGKLSKDAYFSYEYTETNGIHHIIAMGLIREEPFEYGFAECLMNGEEYIGTYVLYFPNLGDAREARLHPQWHKKWLEEVVLPIQNRRQ